MRRHSNASSAGSKSRRTAPIAAMLAVVAALLGLASSASAADRAFELVSPASKGGTDVLSESTGLPGQTMPTISDEGDAVAYVAFNALPGADPKANGANNYYLSRRSGAGWAPSQLSSPLKPIFGVNTVVYELFTPDLAKAVQSGPVSPPATPDASDMTNHLYLWDGGDFSLLTEGMPATGFPSVSASSADFGHIVFSVAGEQLNEEPPLGVSPILYDWDAATGTAKIVGILPNDDPSPDAVGIATPPGGLGAASQNWNPVSDDGSTIFFQSPGGDIVPGQLYARIDGAETKHVSASQRAVPDPLGPRPAVFRVATEDGSVAFFTSSEKLTDDATTGPEDEGEDLYRYEVETETLTDITVDPVDLFGAQVQGVIGAADDGSRVYFVAKGVLDAGATAGQNNLYVWTADGDAPEGEISFIATGVDEENWLRAQTSPQKEHVAGRVTPDGEHALFVSSADIGGAPANDFDQAFLYDASTGELTCASCDPDGTPSTANALLFGTGDANRFGRTLTDDGRKVFFTTSGQLLGADTNAVADVYEFDAELGALNLISTGTGANAALFSDASADGRDVIFVTRTRLVGIDRDSNFDAYDARIGGGLASQNPPPPPPPCVGEGCRGPVVAVPPASAPGSNTHSGPGNQKPKHKKSKKKGKKGKKKQGNGNGNRNGRR